jgi:hypothetical protein
MILQVYTFDKSIGMVLLIMYLQAPKRKESFLTWKIQNVYNSITVLQLIL